MREFFKQFYSVQDLEMFFNDYFEFYKRVYGIDYFYLEYYDAIHEMVKFFSEHHYTLSQFTLFQLDLIKLGFLNKLTKQELESYIDPCLNEVQMEEKYQKILNYENK